MQDFLAHQAIIYIASLGQGAKVTQAYKKNLPPILSLLYECFWVHCFSKIINPLKAWFYKIYEEPLLLSSKFHGETWKIITHYVINLLIFKAIFRGTIKKYASTQERCLDDTK